MEDKREVTKEQGNNLKNNYEFDLFMEASAKTGFNCNSIFNEAAIILYNDYKQYERKKSTVKISKNDRKVRVKKKCC